MAIICIDPGHGGTDPGATNGALYEKDVVLDIALKLKKLLQDAGYEVFMTREKDIYNTPYQKAAYGNNVKADIFVSIHCNSATSEQANGTETLIYGGPEGERLGKCIQESLIKELVLTDRGVKIRKELTVLNSTNMPAVLVETAFISNPEEKLLLLKTEFKAKVSLGIFNGIEEYFGKGSNTMTLEEAKKIVKEKYNFDDNTMLYLEMYRYGENLLKRLAER